MTLQKQINNQDSKKENNKYKYKKPYNSNVCFYAGSKDITDHLLHVMLQRR